MKDYDICILGAGIAGLYCARELSKKYPELNPNKICILEKYKWIGGRISTFRSPIEGISWEAGAGRIHSSHHGVLSLLSEYGLQTVELSPGIDYRDTGHVEPIEFGRYLEALGGIQDLDPSIVSNHTLKEILEKTLGKSQTTELIDRYEYRSELDTLRADKAIDILTKGALSNNNRSGRFYIVRDGFSALIGALKRDIESRGVSILREHEVLNIEKSQKDQKGSYTILLRNRPSIRVLKKVIVTLPRDAVALLPCFRNTKGFDDILNQVKMRPLVRIYAIFPVDGKAWFHGIRKFVCPAPVRYVLPMDSTKGSIMISYTDGKDAEYWMRMIDRDGEATVMQTVMKQIRALFPTILIPDPVYFKCHPWTSACSYWLPGNSEVGRHSLEPLPNVYMCGESWATEQCWVQSSLDTVKSLLNTI